jgi:hypothetical protein
MTSRSPQLLSASMFALLMGMTIPALGGCSPIYIFQFSSDMRHEIDATDLKARLGALLDARGFRSIGFTDRATGEIGCGRNAPDRTTFEKAWGATSFMATHRWVWVHEFSCEGAWRVVVVSSRSADREAAELRDALSAEFDPEIAAGGLHVEAGHRLALE